MPRKKPVVLGSLDKKSLKETFSKRIEKEVAEQTKDKNEEVLHCSHCKDGILKDVSPLVVLGGMVLRECQSCNEREYV